MKDLLVEIGVEELPHAFCKSAIDDFRNSFTAILKEERIGFGRVREFATPRRLALSVSEVHETQADLEEEKRGPSYEKAYVNGKPTQALTGFLKGYDIGEKELILRETENGMYVFALKAVKGKKTLLVLPLILHRSLTSLRFLKMMRWESSGFTFARPIRWIMFLLGEKVVPFELAGVTASRYTYGHRAYCDARIELRNPLEYEEKLIAASVIPDREIRKKEINEQVDTLSSAKGLEVSDTGSLLYDVNADLTELPRAVLCQFNEHFLDLPTEVLTSEMIEHQHYFPLLDKKSKKLTNFFIVVSNIKNNDRSMSGYQRVLHARLDDGKFFFNEDKKKNLRSYLDKLRTVIFHEKLGSMYQKVERIAALSTILTESLSLRTDEKRSIDDVAWLCKNDLLTLMIGEFPHLQGIMGYYYALSSGYQEKVAVGIKEHYYPRFANDLLPSSIEGAVVGIADRLDTIIGIFSIGLKPKGSKDPFALRRKVLAIIKIIIGLNLHFSLRTLIDGALKLCRVNDKESVKRDLELFFQNRIRSIFAEMGFAYDEIDASISGVLDDTYEAYRRVEAFHNLRGDENFEALLISFKRMSNITKNEKDFEFSESLLREKEESTLYAHFQNVRESVVRNIEEKNYREVYRFLSSFKPVVDNFFDNVLVMEKNLKLRRNRLGLLKSVTELFSGIIDFTKVVQPGE
jgi:glycyl-tRNA synthetase beta chain